MTVAPVGALDDESVHAPSLRLDVPPVSSAPGLLAYDAGMAGSKAKPFNFEPGMRILLKGRSRSCSPSTSVSCPTPSKRRRGGGEPFDFDGVGTCWPTCWASCGATGMQSHKLVVLDAAEQFVKKKSHRRGLEAYAAAPMEEATPCPDDGDQAPKLEKAIAGCGAVVLRGLMPHGHAVLRSRVENPWR